MNQTQSYDNKAYENAFTVNCDSGLSLTGDYVIAAMGRTANVENIGLENVGLEYTKNGIKVNKHLQTAVPNIYASGDVADSGIAKLVTVAIHQSKYLAKELLGEADSLSCCSSCRLYNSKDSDSRSSCIYC